MVHLVLHRFLAQIDYILFYEAKYEIKSSTPLLSLQKRFPERVNSIRKFKNAFWRLSFKTETYLNLVLSPSIIE